MRRPGGWPGFSRWFNVIRRVKDLAVGIGESAAIDRGHRDASCSIDRFCNGLIFERADLRGVDIACIARFCRITGVVEPLHAEALLLEPLDNILWVADSVVDLHRQI